MAWPTHSQKDYDAVKEGVVRDIMKEVLEQHEKELCNKIIEVSGKNSDLFGEFIDNLSNSIKPLL